MMNELSIGTQLWNYNDVRLVMDEFLALYEERPVRDNRGGMSSTHLFWTWYVLKK